MQLALLQTSQKRLGQGWLHLINLETLFPVNIALVTIILGIDLVHDLIIILI